MALTKITSKVLGDEFTTSSALSGTAIDWTASQVFTKTLSGATTFTYTNDAIGMVKDLVLTGDYAITWPSGTKIISGTNDGLLFANSSATENTGYDRITFSSTGFYWNTAYGGNSNGYTYFYLAIA